MYTVKTCLIIKLKFHITYQSENASLLKSNGRSHLAKLVALKHHKTAPCMIHLVFFLIFRVFTRPAKGPKVLESARLGDVSDVSPSVNLLAGVEGRKPQMHTNALLFVMLDPTDPSDKLNWYTALCLPPTECVCILLAKAVKVSTLHCLAVICKRSVSSLWTHEVDRLPEKKQDVELWTLVNTCNHYWFLIAKTGA